MFRTTCGSRLAQLAQLAQAVFAHPETAKDNSFAPYTLSTSPIGLMVGISPSSGGKNWKMSAFFDSPTLDATTFIAPTDIRVAEHERWDT
jgi:hypothetical protein